MSSLCFFSYALHYFLQNITPSYEYKESINSQLRQFPNQTLFEFFNINRKYNKNNASTSRFYIVRRFIQVEFAVTFHWILVSFIKDKLTPCMTSMQLNRRLQQQKINLYSTSQIDERRSSIDILFFTTCESRNHTSKVSDSLMTD